MPLKLKRKLSALVAICLLLGRAAAKYAEKMLTEFHELSAKTPDGKVYRMDDFGGTVTAIVTAPRKCDDGIFYRMLEHIHSLHPYALEIVAFPFTSRDVDTSECHLELLAREVRGSETVRIMAGVDINGPDTHPVFRYLKDLYGMDEMEEEYPYYFLVDPDGVPAEVHYAAGYETLKKFVDKYANEEL